MDSFKTARSLSIIIAFNSAALFPSLIFNCASSFITVLAVVKIASTLALNTSWTCFLLLALVIHLLLPIRSAIFPLRVVAVFKMYFGRLSVWLILNTLFNASISGIMQTSTSTPASFNSWTPETRGLGSKAPITTLEILFSMINRVQGGVLPKWEQGSRVT